MRKIYINGHFLHQQLTGVQRYAREVLSGFDEGGYPYTVVEPSSFFSGNKIGHHLWEQLLLPLRPEADAVLWSPANSGPVFAGNHVITLHDAGVFVCPEWFSPAYVKWRKAILPRMAARARTILTVSEFSRKVICKYLPVRPEQVKVVYNGVDRERFKLSGVLAIKKAMEKYGLSGPYLFTLGSMDPRKNFERLIRAWSECAGKAEAKGYTLAIAGGSNGNFGKLDREDTGSVKWLGYVDDADLPALYSGASGFLFPSLFEGFGLTILEAMACGTPVLTSNTTALDEVAGDAALKVCPESTDEIRDGILRLLSTPGERDSLVEKGLQRVKLFNWRNTAAGVYRHLTEQ